FAADFAPRADGTRRMGAGEDPALTGFVAKNHVPDAVTRRLLAAATDLLQQLGPTFADRFPNAYVIAADGSTVMHWPGRGWATGNADWEIMGKVARAGEGAAPASGGTRWSSLYFDYGDNAWRVSATRPVLVDGVEVARVGHDLLLTDLFARVLATDIEGAANCIIDAEGRLLAHPSYMDAIQARGGPIPIAETGDALLTEILALTRAEPAGGIADLSDHGAFVAIKRIEGPDWSLVTRIPKASVAAEAGDVAALILGFGFLALMLELTILSAALRKDVAAPLKQLTEAVDHERKGESGASAAALARGRDRDDELGALARAFSELFQALHQREASLRDGNAQLTFLNERLSQELAERQRAERELERNRELKALLDSIQYGVLFLDADLNVRLANGAYKRLWRTPADFYDQPRTLREDIETSRAQGLYTEPDEAMDAYVERRLAEVRAGPVGPLTLRLSNGTILRYECVALPEGERMLTYYDITELKQAADKLRHHLDGMEASMDGMAMLDPQGCYIYVNDAHAETYGYDRDDMIGMNWRALYDADELARFDEEVFPVLGRHRRWRGEATGLRRDGGTFPQELSLGLTDAGGIVCVVRDVTARRLREEALNGALRDAEDSTAAKSRFLASMSHELRTPLNAIIGFSRLVERHTRGQISDRQSENIRKIQISGEHLLKLINEVLDISRIEAGRADVAHAPFSPAEVVRECVRTLEPMTSPAVTLVGPEDGPDLEAVGDAAKLRQIVVNLLGNAARHTKEGVIRARLRDERAALVIEVEDTGSGIAEDMQERIFEEFGQVEGADADLRGGTGLGLAISRRLARLMGGDVTVRSAVGVGSTFTLRLPRDLRAERAAMRPPAPVEAAK
ncbi:MAG: ATP-binding protein, partial [Pseudomonadota bacterium]